MNQYLILFLLCVSPICVAATQIPGDKAGNGGDILAETFVTKGLTVLKILKNNSKRRDQTEEPILSPQDLVKFEATIKRTRVEVIDTVIKDWDDASVSSRFIPDPKREGRFKIQIRREPWKEYFHKPDIHVYRHVFHEYLNVMDKPDQTYSISGRLNFTLLRSGGDSEVRTCGQTGTVDERIDDCAKPAEEGGFADLAVLVHSVPPQDEWDAFDGPEYYVWNMVSRNENKDRIWADMSGKSPDRIIWSDVSKFSVDLDNGYNAYMHCRSADTVFREAGAEQYKDNVFRWRAPTKREIELALSHGLPKILPHLDKPFFYVYNTDMFKPRLMAGAYLAPEGFTPIKDVTVLYGRVFGRCVRNF